MTPTAITQQSDRVGKSLMDHYQHQLANPIIQEGMQQISLSEKITDTLLGDSYRLNDAIRDIQSRNGHRVVNLADPKIIAVAAGDDDGTITMRGKEKSSNRPLAKLAYAEEFVGDTEQRTAAYSNVREDSSTGSTHKLPAEVEFCKRSNSKPALKIDPHNTNVQPGLTIGQPQKSLFGTGEKPLYSFNAAGSGEIALPLKLLGKPPPQITVPPDIPPSSKSAAESTEFKWTEEGITKLLAANPANKITQPIPPLDIMVRDQSLPTTSRTVVTSDISVEESNIKNLSDDELRTAFGSVTSGIKYIFFGSGEYGAKIIEEHKKRFPEAEGQKNIEALGLRLSSDPISAIIKVGVEKVTGTKLPGEIDPTDFIQKRIGLPNVSGANKLGKDTAPKPKIIEGKAIDINNPEVPGTSGLSKEPHLPTHTSDITAKTKIIENPYLTKNYLKEIKDITKLPVDEKQLPLLKEALKTQEFEKLDAITYKMHKAEFNKMKKQLRMEWEQNTGQKWPVYQEHSVPDRIGQPYDAHHIIQVNHGGPNTWWNIHPAHGLEEHTKIHGVGSRANEIFKPKKK
ncbi:palindromic element RPE1 domain-containing protein [Candidatus Tisiphia endosymbiont of Ceraclea dissimilis]|uniref:palindromic element RPE1 domain-containing protein n=1 Tax=Candidatus Tisiphia endosymbiont of Ceraclea dissimilis TaxID=3077928 RepID=UPI003CCA8E19